MEVEEVSSMVIPTSPHATTKLSINPSKLRVLTGKEPSKGAGGDGKVSITTYRGAQG